MRICVLARFMRSPKSLDDIATIGPKIDEMEN
jgi:hypothetical protein